ncbi:chemotaxis protein CheW [Aestuariicella hydrocarbonica]|uniref:Chemotaxis protein CheW n=1 Tax=Pseudomaricurvus hydrocarbonicus TaxID=1470433 RepID=A0A9E5MNQ6_9GAMM|nr:chemotaxis protein CheW [Aestuariicella hydrocarbonica]NHO67625.1 chemotaxis protein CheW [Aestuariicella hydrocarbonica]
MESAIKTIEQQALEAVPSLMIPLAGRTLLAPTVTVAEMVAYSEPEPVPGAPDWLLGFVEWRDLKVPLLSFEVLSGEGVPEIQPKSRMAVFNNTGVSDDLPFIALPTQGIPKLVRVTEEDISEAEGLSCRALERMYVMLSGEKLLIPDVSALEQVFIDWQKNQ